MLLQNSYHSKGCVAHCNGLLHLASPLDVLGSVCIFVKDDQPKLRTATAHQVQKNFHLPAQQLRSRCFICMTSVNTCQIQESNKNRRYNKTQS